MQHESRQADEASDRKAEPGECTNTVAQLRHEDTRLECLMELSAAFYWEQDEDYRFIVSIGPATDTNGFDPHYLIGKRRWDDGAVPVGDNSWDRHKADLRARRPFENFLYARPDRDGTFRYINSSGRAIFDEAGRFRGYLGVARDITQEYRAQHLLKLEHAVSSALAQTAGINDALLASIQAICQAEDLEAGEYWSLDEEAQVMRYYEGWCIDDAAVRRFTSEARNAVFQVGTGLVGWVWRNGEPLWIADVNEDPRIMRKAEYREAGWRSALLFPVTIEGRVMGVLDFKTRLDIAIPDDGLLQVIRGLGAQIGQFFQRSCTGITTRKRGTLPQHIGTRRRRYRACCARRPLHLRQSPVVRDPRIQRAGIAGNDGQASFAPR